MQRPTDSDITDLAFRTLEDVLARAHNGPVQHSWGVKLALAWMSSKGATLDWHCRSFWQVMAHERSYKAGDSDEYPRTTQLRGALDYWYRELGRKEPDLSEREKIRQKAAGR